MLDAGYVQPRQGFAQRPISTRLEIGSVVAWVVIATVTVGLSPVEEDPSFIGGDGNGILPA